MVAAAILSGIHLLTLALGLGAVVARGRALAGVLDTVGWNRLLAADNLWGIAAVIWIASGVARLFFGGRTPGFYWHNGFFWVKLALFGLVFALEIAPMVTFMRARAALARGRPMPDVPIALYRRINGTEVGLIVTIVFVAAFMARGAWLF